MTASDLESLDYKLGQKVRSCRLAKGYTQKDLAKKIGVTYQVVLQYEKGIRKISIEKLYAIAEILSIGIVDLIPVSNEKICLEDEGEEILNLIRKYKTINDQELRKVFCLLTKFAQVVEKSSKKSEKVKIAKGLVKAGISVDTVSKTIGLSADECVEEKGGSIYCQIGKKIKEWRLVREYTQKDLAEKMDTTRDEISNYEQGRVAITLEKLYAIADTLSISITDLLIEEDESSKVENELPDLIREYKKIESQELRNALIKSLFENLQICEKKIREAERIKIVKDLVKGGIVTDYLPWITSKAGKDRDWSPPDIDEQVMIFSPLGELSLGVVLGGIYQEKYAAPENKKEINSIKFQDGTRLLYDKDKHHLEIEVADKITLKAGGLSIEMTKSEINLKAKRINLN